jgi:hypothetical protein
MPALARTTQPGFNRRPDLHRLIHSNTSKTATTSRSRIRKPTIFAIHRLAGTRSFPTGSALIETGPVRQDAASLDD